MSSPLILQFNKELSLFIVFDVEIIQSYLDLNKCPTFLDLEFVIHLFFLLIVRLSLENAILASI